MYILFDFWGVNDYKQDIDFSYSFGGKKKNQLAQLNDGLSERISIHPVELDRLLDLRILYFSFIKRTSFEESDGRVSLLSSFAGAQSNSLSE